MDKNVLEFLNLLDVVCCKAQKYLASAPRGSLRAVKSGDRIQFFLREENSRGNGMYIKKENKKLVCQLAQKQYCKAVLRIATKSAKGMSEVSNYFDTDILKKVYSDFNPLLKPYIVPFEIDDEEYAQKWKEKPYIKNKREFGLEEYYTKNGERVRSKSEIIIADYLNMLEIPYRYEQGYVLGNGIQVFPDFTVLNKRTRKEFIIEHFGMMDSPEYRDGFFKKLYSYQIDGYIVGKNFIPVFEDLKHPLNTYYLNGVLKHFLL